MYLKNINLYEYGILLENLNNFCEALKPPNNYQLQLRMKKCQ